MTLVLQIVLIAAIVVLTAYLVPLLIQLRRTAASVEQFTQSASEDLRKISTDVHEVRLKVEETAGLATHALEHPSVLSQIILGIAGALPALLGKSDASSGLMTSLMSGVKALFSFYQRSKAAPTKEETHE